MRNCCAEIGHLVMLNQWNPEGYNTARKGRREVHTKFWWENLLGNVLLKTEKYVM
jgi:hypothetical protein